MQFLFRLIGFIAFFYLLFQVFASLFRPVSRKQKKRGREILKREKSQKSREKFYHFKDVIIMRISRKVFLWENTKREYQTLIKRLDLKTTPEEIRALQVILFLGFSGIAFFVFQLNAFLGVLSCLAPFLGWMYPIDEMEKKVQIKNKNIMADFPAFYSLLYYQYARSIHIYLADVVMDFLPNANADMAKELEIFMDDIEYGEEFALKQLKKRLPLRYIMKFSDIMQTRLNGYDNTSQMGYLKAELDKIRIEKLEEELQRRERKNIQTQFALLGILGMYVVIYFYFQFVDAIQLFR